MIRFFECSHCEMYIPSFVVEVSDTEIDYNLRVVRRRDMNPHPNDLDRDKIARRIAMEKVFQIVGTADIIDESIKEIRLYERLMEWASPMLDALICKLLMARFRHVDSLALRTFVRDLFIQHEGD